MMAMIMKLAVLLLVWAAVVQTRADAPVNAPPEPAEENVMLEKKRLVLHRPLSWFRAYRPIRFKSGRRYFWYFSTPRTWAQAEKFCRSIGGNLASVRNRLENNMLLRLIRQRQGRYTPTWIGGSDAQENGIWLWSDGSNYQYTNWCRAEPNNYRGRQHCLQMSFTGYRCWDDLECWNRRPFICLKIGW